MTVFVLALLILYGREQFPEEIAIQSHPTLPAAEVVHDSIESTGDSAEQDMSVAENSESKEPGSKPVSEADLKWLREKTTKDVDQTYVLIIGHLGLSETERKYLIEFLVEAWMSSTRMGDYKPVPIDEGDRQAGIAAIIGDEKLEQFLLMERNRAEYREAARVSDLLKAGGVPLTSGQQDDLLSILIRVRGSEQAVANPNAQRGTVEAIESQIAMMDEYERLVLELAPSVLTSRQTELLFARYQNLSYQRAEMLELQKKTRANEDEEDDFPLGYPPRK
ncbi:MAG: hypothetical protein RLN85_06700 [Pseudomonadales bacterium]